MTAATTLCDDRREPPREPQPVGQILQELLAQYEARYPDVRVVVAETTTA